MCVYENYNTDCSPNSTAGQSKKNVQISADKSVWRNERLPSVPRIAIPRNYHNTDKRLFGKWRVYEWQEVEGADGEEGEEHLRYKYAQAVSGHWRVVFSVGRLIEANGNVFCNQQSKNCTEANAESRPKRVRLSRTMPC